MPSNSTPPIPAGTPPETFSQALYRGTSLKCPLCGQGPLFKHWLRMEAYCSNCRFKFERDPGYFLGSTYINYGLTTILTTWSYIMLRFAMGIDQKWLIPGLATFSIIFPLVFFRYARSLWLSFDCYFDRTGALEQREESGLKQDLKTSKEN